ncbi:PAS domain S-box protein, partial [Methanospirillum hungatei]|uniref:PAS domain S-box protein n=1 Tax=Methanospirillum hungatei TaxID=2203 RepID=UPI0026EE2CD2
RSSYGNIPFILFTGRGREEVVIEALNNGADFYLQKGGDPKAQFAELGHKIRQAVSRLKAEHELIESEKRLSDIINFLPDATFAINRDGIIIAWNQAIEEMTGYSSEQMLGKGNLEYAIPFYGERRKILIDLIFESDDVVAERYSHIIHEKNVLIAEISLPRPKNQVVTLMGKASPLYNSNGEIVGAIESIRDITNLKKAEEELRKQLDLLAIREQQIRDSETKFRAVFERSYEALMLVEDGGLVDCNDIAIHLFGYDSMEDIAGMRPYDSSPPFQPDGQDSQIAAAQHIRAAFENGKEQFEWVHKRKDGSLFPADVFLSTFEINGKKYMQSSIRDITERKKAEHALLLANKKLNLLSSITRNDITNQLDALSGFLELSKDTLTDPKITADFIEKEERIVQIISRQIRFTKDYEDMGVKEPSWQNVAAVVQNVMTRLPVQDIRIEVKTDSLEIFADPLLKQVFYNLLDNSLRYGETLSRIDVFYQKEGEDLLLVWEDNGVGIAEEEKEKIFERGFGKNTGLGMFLVREILSLTDIMITENGKPGDGARFEMNIPQESYRLS